MWFVDIDNKKANYHTGTEIVDELNSVQLDNTSVNLISQNYITRKEERCSH